jgi:hypothetical protein
VEAHTYRTKGSIGNILQGSHHIIMEVHHETL